MSYTVKEMFHTLQGEGANTGRAAVFCRFAGCNLWTGREEDRADADCSFCDTDFVGTDGPGGGRFDDAAALSQRIREIWDAHAQAGAPMVVFTGGEPTLQLDDDLVTACHQEGLYIAIEINGTRAVPEGVDWICVSPKPGPPLVQREGHELKLVYPQAAVAPDEVVGMRFTHRYLQPMDGPEVGAHTAAAAAYCMRDPRWRLSLQTHKLIGLP